MLVKVCGITRMDQFYWLENHDVAMIGLNFYDQSSRFVNHPLSGIKSSSKAKKVGVFVNPELPYLFEKIDEYNLLMVQLHGNESVEFCQEVAKHINIIKAFGVDENFSFANTEPYLNSASYFLFDTKSPAFGGSGKKFNWQKLAEYRFDKPFLLSGGIQLEDIPAINKLNFPALIGIDVNSGFEISPGNKDLDKVGIMMKLIDDDESR
jgi:phosphoribosylanthranilate isomerase